MSGEATDCFLPDPQEISMTRAPAWDQAVHKAGREGVEEVAAVVNAKEDCGRSQEISINALEQKH